MNNSKQKTTFFTIISIECIIISLLLYTHSKSDFEETIHLTGYNEFWKASLNIHLNYDTELIINPKRKDMEIPSKMTVNLIIDDDNIYSNIIQYEPSKNEGLLGEYMLNLDSNRYFTTKTTEVYLQIIYNNNETKILLN